MHMNLICKTEEKEWKMFFIRLRLDKEWQCFILSEERLLKHIFSYPIVQQQQIMPLKFSRERKLLPTRRNIFCRKGYVVEGRNGRLDRNGWIFYEEFKWGGKINILKTNAICTNETRIKPKNYWFIENFIKSLTIP